MTISPTLRTRVLALLLCLLATNVARAQKAPGLGYVFPPSIPAGKTVDVQLGGYDFTPDMQFFIHDARIKLSPQGPPGEFLVPSPPYWFGEKGRSTASLIPREVPAKIFVPAGTPPGLVRWQVANANGSSTTAVFFVSDQPEIIEQRDRDNRQILTSLPVAVSGRLSRIAEVDRYQFTAAKTGPVTIELFARRLGANFNGVIEVRDVSGRMLMDVADTEGRDAAVTFAAIAGRSYVVSLHDVDFRGNRAYVYRLALTAGPRVVTTIPAAGRRGETRVVEFVGYGVATGGSQWESVKQKVTFPKNPQLRALSYRLTTPFGTSPSIAIPLSDLKETVEPARKPGQAIRLAAPIAVTGRLESARDDTYSFTAKKGEFWTITCQSQAIGTKLDLALRITDPKRKRTFAVGDDGTKTTDAATIFHVPADGTYLCEVKDVSGRAGKPLAVYRLSLVRQRPSYELTTTQRLNTPISGQASLTVNAIRTGGFTGAIALSVEGLPSDMTAPESLQIPANKNSLKFTIKRTKNPASHAALIRIVGRATVDGMSVTRTATAPVAGNLCPRDPVASNSSGILLATTMKPPFSLLLVDKNRQRAVHRGTTYPAEFLIKRDAGFQGEVLLMMAAKQGRRRQGIRGPIITVPPTTSQTLYPTFLPEWLETDRTTRMVIQGVAKVVDAQGKTRYLIKAADARITMILEGALLKVSQQSKELTVKPGAAFEIPVRISRSVKLKLPVTIALVVPRALSGLIQCDAVTLSSEKSEAILKVRTRPGAALHREWKFIVRATAIQQGKWPVVSQTDVEVLFPIAAQSN